MPPKNKGFVPICESTRRRSVRQAELSVPAWLRSHGQNASRQGPEPPSKLIGRRNSPHQKNAREPHTCAPLPVAPAASQGDSWQGDLGIGRLNHIARDFQWPAGTEHPAPGGHFGQDGNGHPSAGSVQQEQQSCPLTSSEKGQEVYESNPTDRNPLHI
ncbi:hypothetical protein ANANG_G00292750 [Anguilla anguilla]|uniref:Uncharacterized protein n=1 Tax=Anguilla anguilla TaxID=7936 RepID=A0A9D3LKC3_ANGAN|nr:hypothetical protein ANANG_G00292750 [Anguilla anguilla]